MNDNTLPLIYDARGNGDGAVSCTITGGTKALFQTIRQSY